MKEEPGSESFIPAGAENFENILSAPDWFVAGQDPCLE
jgi:hypothetical protein